MTKRTVTEYEDASIVAFLKLNGYKITPKRRRHDGRVVFEVEGDVSSALRNLYANAPIGVMDYIMTLKALRSSIFSLKSSG